MTTKSTVLSGILAMPLMQSPQYTRSTGSNISPEAAKVWPLSNADGRAKPPAHLSLPRRAFALVPCAFGWEAKRPAVFLEPGLVARHHTAGDTVSKRTAKRKPESAHFVRAKTSAWPEQMAPVFRPANERRPRSLESELLSPDTDSHVAPEAKKTD